MAISDQFAANAGAMNEAVMMTAGRASLWDAFGENMAGVTAVNTGVASGAAMAADAGPQSILEALTSLVTDQKVNEQVVAATAPVEAAPTYNSVANKIADVKVENLQHISAPVQGKVSTSIPADRQANNYALESTTAKLGALDKIDTDLNKIAAAEAAGHPPEQGGAQADVQQEAAGGPGMGSLARGAVIGGAVAAGVTAALGPVAGAVAVGAMAMADFKTVAGMVTGNKGAGTFAGIQESTPKYEKMTKADVRNANASAEGNSPAQNTFSAVANAAPAPAAPARDLADVGMTSDSLAGVEKLKVQESPQLMAMRDTVKGMREEVTLQNDRAQGLKGVFDERGQKGVELTADSVGTALDRNMAITNSAGRLAINGMVA
jgi:hypothetical protein